MTSKFTRKAALMRRTTLPLLALSGLTVVALAGCQAAASASPGDGEGSSAPITIATIPLGDDPSAENPIDALATLLEEQTGRDVEITDVPDYLSVVEAIRADHVDIGIMSGFPSALAVNTGEVDALLAWQGDDTPVSTCVVLDDSPVTEVADLEGATVAFADQASSSGYFMPVYMLHEEGLEQGTDYEAIFAGGHEGSFAALEQGQVDAACTAIMLTQLGEPYFPFADGEWRGIGESPSMPIAGAVLARQSLDDETRTLLEKALPQVFSEENAESLGALGEGFVGRETMIAPDPEEFQGFVDIAAVAGVKLEDLR
ncbi:phosphate/phosphite/phosphonate ABC transporter substrate-binding protein [Microbacterium sp. ET2]|uniref:phosphate/phosphite/phosphonate ABC transporter substrate-binding protein n=1 Tax=Microbacterium albipurpureum TaxID=3050384 RepID=UPI00259D209F|nr:phosphate/phosphite/phosphonate ABC transporter substrate-binding protein [Microbacterium sp. ET2 (Ac-2212)]WJL94919.1 phosphate/phosphite/phosphonate ABC transporter substrate-binding protein [Microbacterium sp. ET2 (Ac-2212)]